MKKLTESNFEIISKHDLDNKKQPNKPIFFQTKSSQEFFFPEKGFCFYAISFVYRDYKQIQQKIFINVCWSELVGNFYTDLVCTHHDYNSDKQSNCKENESDFHKDHCYKVPYVLECVYKSENGKIYDVVFGSKTYRAAMTQNDIMNLIISTCLDCIENQFSENISREKLFKVNETNYKFSLDQNLSLNQKLPSQLKITTPSQIKEDENLSSHESISYLKNIKDDIDIIKIQFGKSYFTSNQKQILIESIIPFMKLKCKRPFFQVIVNKIYKENLLLSIPEIKIRQSINNLTLCAKIENIDLDSLKISLYSNNKTDSLEIINVIEIICRNQKTQEEYGVYIPFQNCFVFNGCEASVLKRSDNLVVVFQKLKLCFWNTLME